MATAIFYSFPAHGHINPSLPVVAELVRRGERIIYYATEPFRAKVEATGAEYRSYNHPMELEPTAEVGSPAFVMDKSADVSKTLLPTLLAEAKIIAPDYLMLDSMCLWGNYIQQCLDIPAVTSASTFLVHPKMNLLSGKFRLPLKGTLMGIPALARYFLKTRQLDKAYGVRSPDLINFFLTPQAMTVVYTSREFQTLGHLFGPEYKFVGPSLAPRTESVAFPFEQLNPDIPLVYVSIGTVFNQNPAFFRACYQAFEGMNCQAVISLGTKVNTDALGTPPPNVIARPYVPQLAILERTSVFVTHGGMNSTSEALLAGVPLVVVPQIGDQLVIANRVIELKAGVGLHNHEVTPEQVAGAIVQVLVDDTYKQQARAIGESFRNAGGFQRAADEILAFRLER